MTYQHQHAGHSYPYEANGEHVQQGTRDQPWTNAYQHISNSVKTPCRSHSGITYDCAFLLPLALPPDLPPVIFA